MINRNVPFKAKFVLGFLLVFIPLWLIIFTGAIKAAFLCLFGSLCE